MKTYWIIFAYTNNVKKYLQDTEMAHFDNKFPEAKWFKSESEARNTVEKASKRYWTGVFGIEKIYVVA